MLAPLLASWLLFTLGGFAPELRAAPQAVAGNVPALTPAEIFDLQGKAESGNADAQFALGKAYETGNGVPQRAELAATWYRKAAEQDNAKAQSGLGVLYWLGNGVGKDKAEAVRWYRKAARRGDANAMFNLGVAYYNGEGAAVDDTLSYAWFLLSAEAGSQSGKDAANRSQKEHGPGSFSDACVAVGQMYEKGEDLPKDLESAATWYRRAGEQGSGEGSLKLAALYLNASDYSPLCEAAAKQRFPGGYYCLGYLYQHGAGVDSKEAFRWYGYGAWEGDVVSMLALARMYESGEGTKPDRVQAFVWYLVAGLRKNQGALAEAKRIRSTMTEKEWKSAQKKLPGNIDPKKINSILQAAHSPAAP